MKIKMELLLKDFNEIKKSIMKKNKYNNIKYSIYISCIKFLKKIILFF